MPLLRFGPCTSWQWSPHLHMVLKMVWSIWLFSGAHRCACHSVTSKFEATSLKRPEIAIISNNSRLGVNHYRYNHYQWPSLPHDNHYQWQSVPHDNHHHMTTINMPCTINTCHHYQVLFCKKIITTWQSPPHDNHHQSFTNTIFY